MNVCARRWIAPLLVVAFAALSCQAKHLAVIVDKANDTAVVSAQDLGKILKFDTRKWQNGRNVVLVLLNPSPRETEEALQRVCKVSGEDLKSLLTAHHGSIVFVDSEESLIKTVAATPGAIGLIDVYSINSQVTVLKVDGKLPLEQGYVLRMN